MSCTWLSFRPGSTAAPCASSTMVCARRRRLTSRLEPDAEDLIAADGNGLLQVGAAARVDLAVDDDQVDRAARIVTLRADDEAGDEGSPDDDDD